METFQEACPGRRPDVIIIDGHENADRAAEGPCDPGREYLVKLPASAISLSCAHAGRAMAKQRTASPHGCGIPIIIEKPRAGRSAGRQEAAASNVNVLFISLGKLTGKELSASARTPTAWWARPACSSSWDRTTLLQERW